MCLVDPNGTVCFCNDIARDMTEDAVAVGAKVLEDMQEVARADTAYGGCLSDIQTIIGKLAK